MPQIICPLLTLRQIHLWMWEISFHFHKTVSSPSLFVWAWADRWYLRLGLLGEAEALRRLWIRLHNESRQKKKEKIQVGGFPHLLFLYFLQCWVKLKLFFFPPSNGTTWPAEYNFLARSYTDDKLHIFLLRGRIHRQWTNEPNKDWQETFRISVHSHRNVNYRWIKTQFREIWNKHPANPRPFHWWFFCYPERFYAQNICDVDCQRTHY